MNKNFVVLECLRLVKTYNYARIHRAGCGHARAPNYKTESTVCHGYFDTYYEARNFAESLRVNDVYECVFCSPRHAYKRVYSNAYD